MSVKKFVQAYSWKSGSKYSAAPSIWLSQTRLMALLLMLSVKES